MNTLTDTEVTALLEGQKEWIRKHTWAYMKTDIQGHEDMCQEAYIAMWKAIQSWDGTGTIEGWMRQNARWKMLELNTWRKRHQNDTPTDDAGDVIWGSLDGPENLAEVFSSYHHGEIMDALNSLSPTQREYVYRRFWLGQLQPEICKAMNIHNPMHLWSRPKYGAKPKLAAMLAHLVEVSA